MASPTSLFIALLEDQVATLVKHIAILKASEAPAVEIPEDTTGKKKNVKKVVDPNKPKRAPSAYILYMTETQGPFKASNPTMTQNEVIGILGKRWKTIAPETAERYHKAAEALKLSQDLKIAEYETGNMVVGAPAEVKKKKPISNLKALILQNVPLPSLASTKAASPAIPTAAGSSNTPLKTTTGEQKSPAAITASDASKPILQESTDSDITPEIAIPTSETKKKKKRKNDNETATGLAAVAPATADSSGAAVVIEALPSAASECEKKKVMGSLIFFTSLMQTLDAKLSSLIHFYFTVSSEEAQEIKDCWRRVGQGNLLQI